MRKKASEYVVKEANVELLTYWLDAGLWTREEAVLLLLGIDPASVTAECFMTFNGEDEIQYEFLSHSPKERATIDYDENGEPLYLSYGHEALFDRTMAKGFGLDLQLNSVDKAEPIKWIEFACEKGIAIPWLDWAIARGRYNPKHELGETATPDLGKDSPTTPPESLIDAPKGERRISVNSTLIFKEMPRLTASELTLAFVGDKPKTGLGANNMLEVTARGQKRRIALAALELVDKRQGTPNGECGILLGLAQGLKPKKSSSNTQKLKRLRLVFLNHFGMVKDPFEPYMAATGWVPLFKIEDRRGLADERAKKEAEEHMDSLEQLAEQGIQLRDRSNDDADDWLKANGHQC